MKMNLVTLATLNNLALANNDRLAAYRQAIETLSKEQDSSNESKDLLAFFSNYLNDSRAFSEQLSRLAGDQFYQPEETMLSVKIPVNYTSTNSHITNERSLVLDICYKEETHACKIYEYAIAEEALPADTRNILLRQKDEVLRAQKVLESLLQRAA